MTEQPVDPFLAWLDMGTTSPEKVTLFMDQKALREHEALMSDRDRLVRRLDAMEDEPESAQRGLGERSERSKVQAEIDAIDEALAPIEERLEASKAVWTIRPLNSDEIDAIDEAHPIPPVPAPTEEQRTTAKGKKRYQQIIEEYTKKVASIKVDLLYARLSAAVVSVETPTATLDSVSVDHLRAMQAREFGGQRIQLLQAALERAMELKGEPSGPFSSSNSGSTQE